MSKGIQIRQVKYLNNRVEQEQHSIKKHVRSMLGFRSHKTVNSSSVEEMHMMKKGLLHPQVKSAQNTIRFIHKLFRISF